MNDSPNIKYNKVWRIKKKEEDQVNEKSLHSHAFRFCKSKYCDESTMGDDMF